MIYENLNIFYRSTKVRFSYFTNKIQNTYNIKERKRIQIFSKNRNAVTNQ